MQLVASWAELSKATTAQERVSGHRAWHTRQAALHRLGRLRAASLAAAVRSTAQRKAYVHLSCGCDTVTTSAAAALSASSGGAAPDAHSAAQQVSSSGFGDQSAPRTRSRFRITPLPHAGARAAQRRAASDAPATSARQGRRPVGQRRQRSCSAVRKMPGQSAAALASPTKRRQPLRRAHPAQRRRAAAACGGQERARAERGRRDGSVALGTGTRAQARPALRARRSGARLRGGRSRPRECRRVRKRAAARQCAARRQ